mmetsp:Transcript_33904/g.69046  ORF Transcript_33904/g.69046 Transcript_33904/m.69046 type:complete len:227 (-) Transcript_33904:206-886(-)
MPPEFVRDIGMDASLEFIVFVSCGLVLLLLSIISKSLSSSINVQSSSALSTRFFFWDAVDELVGNDDPVEGVKEEIFDPPPIGMDVGALLFLLLVLISLLLLAIAADSVAKTLSAPSTPLRTQPISFRLYSRCFSSTRLVTAVILLFLACCDDLFPPVDAISSDGVDVVMRLTICNSLGSTDDDDDEFDLRNCCSDSDIKEGLDGTRCRGLFVAVPGGTGEVDPDL